MKRCPFCAEEIQDEAAVCRHCNRDFKAEAEKQQNAKLTAIGCLGLLALLVIGGLMGGSGSNPTEQPEQGSEIGAFVACQKFVTDRLRSPGSAEFPSIVADGVTVTQRSGDKRYAVYAYVDSQNAFGALLRTRFSCIVTWQSGSAYRLDDLQIKD